MQPIVLEEIEKNITFVIPVYGESGIWLNRCIESLLDQNWKNKKIVVVYDGAEHLQSALKQAVDYKEHPDIRFITNLNHSNASRARNFGLKYVRRQSEWKCDYICFFDCDSMLLAGSVALWMKAFDENPDCGFVYGGYRFNTNTEHSMVIPARPFDYYLLTCNNYIDTKNPIKFELCPEWDEELENLQDWDFWLRASKHVKGKFIEDILILTEQPNEGSITYKTCQNWKEVYNKVREKNGIPNREIVVASMGAPFQSIRRAKLLQADYRDVEMLLYKPHDYKAIISMGFYVDSPAGAYTIFSNVNEGCKKIIYFIGTDVFQLSGKRFMDVRYFAEHVKNKVDHIFCNAPWLQKELSLMGVEAELLYCPIDFTGYIVKPPPSNFTIAFYFHDTNDMHLTPITVEVAKQCPDIKFKLFGGTSYKTRKDTPDNIEVAGVVKEQDMPEFIASTSALLRLTIHDGFPATASEWLACERPVICNIPDMPHTIFADINMQRYNPARDWQKLNGIIRDLKENYYSLEMAQKMREANNFYRGLLNPEIFIKRIYEVCELNYSF